MAKLHYMQIFKIVRPSFHNASTNRKTTRAFPSYLGKFFLSMTERPEWFSDFAATQANVMQTGWCCYCKNDWRRPYAKNQNAKIFL